MSTGAALELLLGDYPRYCLTAQAPESDDSSLAGNCSPARCNEDLADTLRDFVCRVLSFSRDRFGDEVPAGGQPGEGDVTRGAGC
ncbi:hypothetical protein [Streptodolium elevatio]|uniref:hypothetical protein n=1 Tax=Streptodolium elevatio TaxID=3157996 RepID=UPI003F4CFD75